MDSFKGHPIYHPFPPERRAKLRVFILLLIWTAPIFADDYKPLPNIVVTPDEIIILTGAGGRFSVGSCMIDDNTFKFSKWQRRLTAEDAWEDIPETEVEGGICVYTPTEAGQYRVVGEWVVGDTPGLYSSFNIIIVKENGEWELVEAEEEESTSVTREATWGQIKSWRK